MIRLILLAWTGLSILLASWFSWIGWCKYRLKYAARQLRRETRRVGDGDHAEQTGTPCWEVPPQP